MEGFNSNCTTKRYNQFRLTRKKKARYAPMEIDVDETKGKRYTLERFLKDCGKHLPSQELSKDPDDPAPEGEAAQEVSKRRKTKHVKLPVLNESKGIFENVIIGRSAKKVEKFAEVAATPEDRARLQEDIHALARVGPDSELSFEMIPPTQQPDDPRDGLPEAQNSHGDTPRDTSDADRDSLRGFTPVPQETLNISEQPLETLNRMTLQAGSSHEEPNRTNANSSKMDASQNGEVISVEDFFQQARGPSGVIDSSFKDAVGSQNEDKPEQAASHHCECCQRRSSRKKSFFDADAILKSNGTEANEGRNVGRSVNEIFSNHQAWRSLELKDWSYPGSPSNLVGSTYPSRSFHLPGIEIQSRAVSQDDCGDVYCGSRPKEFGFSRVSTITTDFNKGFYSGESTTDEKRYHRSQQFLRGENQKQQKLPLINRTMNRSALKSDPTSLDLVLHQMSTPYNKFRYDRPPSPREY